MDGKSKVNTRPVKRIVGALIIVNLVFALAVVPVSGIAATIVEVTIISSYEGLRRDGAVIENKEILEGIYKKSGYRNVPAFLLMDNHHMFVLIGWIMCGVFMVNALLLSYCWLWLRRYMKS